LLIHEIIAFSIFFHIFLTFKTIKNKNLTNIVSYIFLFSIIFFILIFPQNNLAIEKLRELANERGLFFEAMGYASSFSNIKSYILEFKQNFFIAYNAIIHFFFIFIATLPLTLFLIYLKNNKYLKSNKLDLIMSALILAPYLSFFAIGDAGRWISLMSFTSLGIFYQYKLSRKISNPSFVNFNLKKKNTLFNYFNNCFHFMFFY
jgi:Gpi18-like mannosyltransferase